jgi:thiosulfate/3-mercaptopyruvate sulfurtransferase
MAAMRQPRTSPLICVDQLAADLACGTRPVLLDVRWKLAGPPGHGVYLAGHIPGARYVDLDTELAEPLHGATGPRGRHPLPDPEDFAAAMRRAGVAAGDPVVVYDDADGMQAARLWWLLRHHGHDDVRVLDGGFAAWKIAGHPVEEGEPGGAAPEGDFTALTPGRFPVLDHAGAAALAAGGLLVDARAAERYRGETEPVDPVAGHIPGAVSAPTTANLAADNRFLREHALVEHFAALGIAKETVEASDEVVVGAYCGSGVTATHEILALAVAGIDPARVALYEGSWSGWTSDPSRPVAVGAEPSGK